MGSVITCRLADTDTDTDTDTNTDTDADADGLQTHFVGVSVSVGFCVSVGVVQCEHSITETNTNIPFCLFLINRFILKHVVICNIAFIPNIYIYIF